MSGQIARILIAEDEVLIAHLIEASLEDEGLATTVVFSGSEAIQALEAAPTGFQVLITDIRVGPGPNGWTVAQAGRAANTALAVIYMTGDSMYDWRANGVPDSVLITKPFVPAQIVSAVMTLLNHASGSPSP